MIKSKKSRLLLLDRDGVLNKLVYREYRMRAPINLEDIYIEDFVIDEINGLRENYEFAIVTNQPDFEKMKLSRTLGIEINHKIAEEVGINSSYICFHFLEKCNCRKPETGLLKLAMLALGYNQNNTILVGDRWTDILAARKIDIPSILISKNISGSFSSSSNGESPPLDLTPNFIVEDFRSLSKLLNRIKM